MDSERSINLFERAQRWIPGGVHSPVRAFRAVKGRPFFTESANGCRLTTVDGVELIDYVCTWGPAIHGHSCPEIREAITQALQKGTSFGTPHPDEVTLAEWIVKCVPSIEKVRMVNSGTEATMSCIRLARGYTGHTQIIKFSGCYHGHVDALLVKAGSGALTFGYPDSAGISQDVAAETLVLPYNDLRALQEAFAQHTIAAVIIEPYPANCGLILPRPGYLRALRQLCTENQALLIFDEVMTGFRVGLGGVQEREGVLPDLTALGKIIGGGLPVGAFGGRADIMDQLAPLGPVYQAGTLSGNPLAMTAGITAIERLKKADPYKTLHQMGATLRQHLLATAQSKGIPLQIPHSGSMFSLLFTETPVCNFNTATTSNTELFSKFFHYALGNGIYLPPSPYETCFLSTAHDAAALDQTITVLTQGIKRL